jgi:hypothetical protein
VRVLRCYAVSFDSREPHKPASPRAFYLERENGEQGARRFLLVASGDDASGGTGVTRVLRDRFRCGEGAVALDGQAPRAGDFLDLRYAHVAEFGEAVPEVAEAERDIGIVVVDLREEPGRLRVGGEELHDRSVVDPAAAGFRYRLLKAVLEELLA